MKKLLLVLFLAIALPVKAADMEQLLQEARNMAIQKIFQKAIEQALVVYQNYNWQH
jgi:shikimate kinase